MISNVREDKKPTGIKPRVRKTIFNQLKNDGHSWPDPERSDLVDGAQGILDTVLYTAIGENSIFMVGDANRNNSNKKFKNKP
jgi:hypothetical protein